MVRVLIRHNGSLNAAICDEVLYFAYLAGGFSRLRLPLESEQRDRRALGPGVVDVLRLPSVGSATPLVTP